MFLLKFVAFFNLGFSNLPHFRKVRYRYLKCENFKIDISGRSKDRTASDRLLLIDDNRY
jgi:hypothetical protein